MRLIEQVVKMSDEKLLRLQKKQTNDRMYYCNFFYMLKLGKPNQNWNGQLVAAHIRSWHV